MEEKTQEETIMEVKKTGRQRKALFNYWNSPATATREDEEEEEKEEEKKATTKKI